MSDDMPPDYYARSNAARLAVDSGAKDVVKTATDIYNFLLAGNASSATEKPATRGVKADKVDVPRTEPAATEQSSEKPADTKSTTDATSRSEASGFADDGSEVSKQDVIAAATKYVGSEGKTEADLVAVFGEFGASKLSELEVSDYAAVIAKLAVPASGAFD
ncbi:MAG: hypothetical protein ACRCWJ_15235 [Casimicrobium sp.]